MPDSPLRYDISAGIATITLNRPEARNALSPEMLCRLADAFTKADEDEKVRVVILTGTGDKVFCAGGDLALTLPLMTGTRAPETEWDYRLLEDPDVMRRSSLRDWTFDKPVIVAINGHCMAAGMEISLACDIRISVEGAFFALPEVKRGLIPFAGALARLPRYIPHGIAMEMLMTGDALPAERALAAGLVNQLVPRDELMPLARSMAQSIAANGPYAVQTVKRSVREIAGRTYAEGFAIENDAKTRVMATADAREGPRAFMEKRTPTYTGS